MACGDCEAGTSGVAATQCSACPANARVEPGIQLIYLFVYFEQPSHAPVAPYGYQMLGNETLRPAFLKIGLKN